MKRLMEILKCDECKYLKIKNGVNKHYYTCTILKHKSSDIHDNIGLVQKEKETWFENCTIWELSERSCKTCKHWGEYENLEHVPEIRRCLKIDEYQECFISGKENYEPLTLKKNKEHMLAFTFDYDLFSSGIKTRSNFFCKMYETKDII